MTGSEFPRNEGPSPHERDEPIPPTIYTRTEFDLTVNRLPFKHYQHTNMTGFVHVMPDVLRLEAAAGEIIGPAEQQQCGISLLLQYRNETYDLTSEEQRDQLQDARGVVYAVADSLPSKQENWLKGLWAGNLLDEQRDRDWREAVVSFLLDKPPFLVGQYAVDTINVSTPNWDVSGQRHTWNGVYMNMQGIPGSHLRLSLKVEGDGITYDYSLRADDSEQLLKIGDDPALREEWRGLPGRRCLPITDQSMAEFTGILREILSANSNH